MVHKNRTKILSCRVSYAGYTYPRAVDVAVSDDTYNGINSTDWQLRARKFAGLATQIRMKMDKMGYDMEGKFLFEKDITILEVRPIKGAPPIDEPF